MTLAAWLALLGATLLVSVFPGPGALLVSGTTLKVGLRAGFCVIAGLQLAILCHLGLVFLGVAALLAAQPLVFDLLAILGGLYLCWLGLQQWQGAGVPTAVEAQAAGGVSRHVLAGLLVNLTNPKALLFLFALVPQFIERTQSLGMQAVLIAATVCGVDIVIMGIYAILAQRYAGVRPGRGMVRLSRALGGVLISLGA